MNKNISRIETITINSNGIETTSDLFDTVPQLKVRYRLKDIEYQVDFIVYNFDRNKIQIFCSQLR